MASKDLIVNEIRDKLPKNSESQARLVDRFLEQLAIGPYDKKYWPAKDVFKCSKDLTGKKIPYNVLENCVFKRGQNLLETVQNLCSGMDSVLKWTFADCNGYGDGSNRALRSITKLSNLCGKIIKNIKKAHYPPITPDPPCPYDGKNKICDGSGKCGLAHFGSCVQFEKMTAGCRQQEVGQMITNIMKMLNAAAEPFESGKCNNNSRSLGFRAIFPDVKDVPECKVSAGAVPCGKFKGLSAIVDPMEFHDLVSAFHSSWTSNGHCNREFGVHFSAYLDRLKNSIKNC